MRKLAILAESKSGHVDFVTLQGSDKGNSELGIYEVKGDTLRICVTQSLYETERDPDGKRTRHKAATERPKKFEARSGYLLQVWKRVKK